MTAFWGTWYCNVFSIVYFFVKVVLHTQKIMILKHKRSTIYPRRITVVCILVQILQDSEETIHSAEKNDTSYESQGYFHWKKCFLKNKVQNGQLKKSSFSSSSNSQYFFTKISWIVPLVSIVDWCEGHWCASTYMVVRLSEASSKTGKKCIFVF